jgi:hypothetical protein
MFATMVLTLPFYHIGGELAVRHLRQEVVLDLRPEEPSEIGFAAFYADCVHEVRPVTSGCRVALVFNLCFPGRKQPPQAPDYRPEQKQLTTVLQRWATGTEQPDKLILGLDHAYTPAELSFETLKGRDAAIASVLAPAPAAAAADCDLHLALVTIAEYGGAFRVGGCWGEEDDEDDFEVSEIDDRGMMLSALRPPDGAAVLGWRASLRRGGSLSGGRIRRPHAR